MKSDIHQIWKDLEWLASCPRPAESERLEECRRYCEDELQHAGWKVTRQAFHATDPDGCRLSGQNLVAHHSSEREISNRLILGAHVDSRPETPGADDNASAVAVLLEVARIFGRQLADPSRKTTLTGLELVVFDLEEHGMLGGDFHAQQCRRLQRPVRGMVSLEMLGYCSHEPGSQKFPPEIAHRFPDVGNFIGVVGNQNSTDLLQHFVDSFQSVPDLPCEFLQVPEDGRTFPPTRLSDHSPFWDQGFAALMVTDTSFMRNPHYHLPSDTPDTLDAAFLHKVAEGVVVATERMLFATS